MELYEGKEFLEIDRNNLKMFNEENDKKYIQKKQLDEIMCDYINDYKVDGEDIDVVRSVFKYLKQI